MFSHVLGAGGPRARHGQRWFLPRPISRACSHGLLPRGLLPGASPGGPLCVCVLISSPKDTSHEGLGPLTGPHFTLITSVKTLSPNAVSAPACSDHNTSLSLLLLPTPHSSYPRRSQRIRQRWNFYSHLGCKVKCFRVKLHPSRMPATQRGEFIFLFYKSVFCVHLSTYKGTLYARQQMTLDLELAP